ncbi:NAD(P)-dependent oxidoreductase [Ferruginibacter sp. SUN106]|uniref:NAD(P)-dependent oxidoreductase n=1 Tax=Ferruginibacter sp. SUN106 TaxID=2978348 RepID=UPI003D3677BE
MTIIVFGATGMVGKQLVQQALFKGYSVKAFGRNVFSEFDTDTKNLELIKGALFDEGEVQDAIKGCDAVLSALGGGFDGNDKTRTLGIKNIIAQMKKNGVQRIVAIGGMGVLNADEDTLILDTENYPKEMIPVGKEHQQAYQYLKESGVDFTFVCPPAIKDHEATGAFTTNADYLPEPNNNIINSGDLALFMLNELEKNEYVKKRVGISN